MFGNGFTPGASGTIDVTTSSKSLAVTGRGKTLYVNNAGESECFIAIGGSTVTVVGPTGDAMGGGMSLSPGAYFALGMDANTHIAAICASGSTTLRVTRGDGQ